MPWSGRPVAQMREYVAVVRGAWTAWQEGTRPSIRGEFYRFTLSHLSSTPAPSNIRSFRSTSPPSARVWSGWRARWPTGSSSIPCTRAPTWRMSSCRRSQPPRPPRTGMPRPSSSRPRSSSRPTTTRSPGPDARSALRLDANLSAARASRMGHRGRCARRSRPARALGRDARGRHRRDGERLRRGKRAGRTARGSRTAGRWRARPRRAHPPFDTGPWKALVP